jgi:hypothetical protein
VSHLVVDSVRTALYPEVVHLWYGERVAQSAGDLSVAPDFPVGPWFRVTYGTV